MQPRPGGKPGPNEFAQTEEAKNQHYPSLLKEAIEDAVAVASARSREKKAFDRTMSHLTMTKADGSVRVQGHVADLVVLLQAAQKVNMEELAKTRLHRRPTNNPKPLSCVKSVPDSAFCN